MTIKLAIALALVALLCACDHRSTTDQCLRAELFQQCLKTSHHPAYPSAQEKVIAACSTEAAYQALRPVQFVKPECRP